MGSYQDVGGFEIPMGNILLMQIVNTICHLNGDRDHLGRGELVHHALQIPVTKLQHQKLFLQTHTIVRQDIRMPQISTTNPIQSNV